MSATDTTVVVGGTCSTATTVSGFIPAPVVTSVSPSSGTDLGGTSITVTGKNFLTGAVVKIGGTSCTGVSVVSSTSITCTTAAKTAGTYDLTVSTSGGTGTKTSAFTYTPSWAPNTASVPLRAWYRADLGVTQAGGLVSAWADQSGAGDLNRNLAQGSDPNKPGFSASDASYGNQPVLIGSNVASTSMPRVGAWSVAPSTPITLLVVGEITANPSSYISDGATTNMLWGNGPTGKFFSTIGPLSSGADISVPSVLMFTDDGSGAGNAAKIYVTNVTTAAASTTTIFGGGTTGFSLGVGVAGVGAFTGKVAEIIVWAGVLTAGDITGLKNYLNITRAYGLGVT